MWTWQDQSGQLVLKDPTGRVQASIVREGEITFTHIAGESRPRSYGYPLHHCKVLAERMVAIKLAESLRLLAHIGGNNA